MTRDAFDQLARQVEDFARRHPRAFIVRVFALLLLAYGYLGLVLVVSLALVVGTIAGLALMHNLAVLKLGLFLLVAACGLCWAVVRGLWVRLEPPGGHPLTREQAPQLFALLDELRQALDCHPFHQVLLVGDHNAAVAQIPRLGVFGWHRNYLLLGLPLLLSLAPDEFKAVLAHEFAHSSRGHGRFGSRLYRLRRSWEQIFAQMALQGTHGDFVLTTFIEWFWPRFNAHAFVLARANEYEADACSVRLAGADAAARALLRLPVDDALLSDAFWPKILARANTEPAPPTAVMTEMAQAFAAGLPPETAAKHLRQAFLQETNTADTHPCLKDRLRAIGRLPPEADRGEVPATPPPRPARTAAETYLGHHLPSASQQLSDAWCQAMSPAWTQRYTKARQLAADLDTSERPDAPPPSREDLWAKAQKLISLRGDNAAIPVLETLLTLDPEHPAANFIRGRHYLAEDDPRGVEHIEKAMANEPALTEEGCGLLYAHFTRTGQRDRLRPLLERVDRYQEASALARKERSNISVHDPLIPHDLSPAQIDHLRAVLATEPEIVEAAAARKQVKLFPASPCYLVALRIKSAWWKPRSETANQKIVERVVQKLQLPGHFLVFVQEQSLKPLGKKVFALPDATLYSRTTD